MINDDWELTEADLAKIAAIDHRHSPLQPTAGAELDCRIASLLNVEVRPFSTDWTAAMSAAESLIDRPWGFRMHSITPMGRSNIRFAAEFFDGEPIISNGVGDVVGWVEYGGVAPTGPLAICRAIVEMKEAEAARGQSQ
jgi:hypothetical protein